MTNWQENLRLMQEAEKQRFADERKQLSAQQQEEQLRQERKLDTEAQIQKQSEEKKLKFSNILDQLQVREQLEDIRHRIWRDEGLVTGDKTDLGRFVRLSFDYESVVEEHEFKGKYEIAEYHVSRDYGNSGDPVREKRYVTKDDRIVRKHKAVKPSYLEVGVGYKNSDPIFLYILDTEIDLGEESKHSSAKTGGHFHKLNELAGKTGGGSYVNWRRRLINYTDSAGNIFTNKLLSHDHKGLVGLLTGYETRYSFLKEYHFTHSVGVALSSKSDVGALSEFVNYGLALSCLLRTSENKLPFQLK